MCSTHRKRNYGRLIFLSYERHQRYKKKRMAPLLFRPPLQTSSKVQTSSQTTKQTKIRIQSKQKNFSNQQQNKNFDPIAKKIFSPSARKKNSAAKLNRKFIFS